jgi:CubicO group peptidase (beta-lactamase class C family)
MMGVVFPFCRLSIDSEVAIWMSTGSLTFTLASKNRRPSVVSGWDSGKWEEIDLLITGAIERGVFPGATVLIADEHRVLYEKSFGFAALYADERKTRLANPVPARNDTIYDIASLTKLFTAIAVMKLAEEGEIGLDDPVSRHVPEFGTGGKEDVTVRQLLAHTGGLPASVHLDLVPGGPAERVKVALSCPPAAKPGTLMVYSDLGYIVLGELVKQVSGKSLDRFLEEFVFEPLELCSTMFCPPASLAERIAATEVQLHTGRGLVWGEVHDEDAWALGGVAGHAGVFSTARDLATVASLFLNGGSRNGKRILRPDTVREMVRLQTNGIPGAFRGLGVELNRGYYMGPFADLMTCGHTGFTGTSLFVSLRHRIMVVLLTNRVHPVRTGPNVSEVRRKLAELVFTAMERDTVVPTHA